MKDVLQYCIDEGFVTIFYCWTGKGSHYSRLCQAGIPHGVFQTIRSNIMVVAIESTAYPVDEDFVRRYGIELPSVEDVDARALLFIHQAKERHENFYGDIYPHLVDIKEPKWTPLPSDNQNQI